MPMLVSTPEQWFRARQCDLYHFRLADGQKGLPVELKDWIAKNLLDPKNQILGPSEHSGWISGGPCFPTIAMSDAEVLKFSDRWEDADGKSLDPCWQCYQRRYTDWLETFDRIEVFKGRPPKGAQYRWLLCDAGLYWLKGRYKDTDTSYREFPGEPCIDDWWWACRKFPEIQAATFEPFLMSYDCLGVNGERIVTFESYSQSDGDVTYGPISERNLAKAKVREALGYSVDFDVNIGFF